MLKIYDTTLRDGSQKEGISYSTEDKVRITKALDQLGVDYVEGGWPGSNPKDIEYFLRVKDMHFKNLKIAAFGSTRRANIEAADDHNLNQIIKSKVKVATIFGKTWDLHVRVALKTTLEENLKMIESSIAYLKENGLEVNFDAEHFFDGYKANPEYAKEVIKAAQRGGADAIIFCDTNGGTLPRNVKKIIDDVKGLITCEMGIHAHNDAELAVANSLVAFETGVNHIQGTINGFGERCGNANLSSLIPNLLLKYNDSLLPKINLRKMTETSRFVSEIINTSHPSYLPYVGTSAFTHKGGIHVSAILKNATTYEHVDPSLVGNHQEVVVSELSGQSNIIYKAKELGVQLDQEKDDLRNVVKQVKALEHQGYHFEGADGSLRILIEKALNRFEELFQLESARIITEKRKDEDAYSEVSIKVNVKGQEVHTASAGNGPVNALDKAMRKALVDFYPRLKDFYLVDYKVRVLDSNDGTEAKVRVLIETSDGNTTWGTVGASTNIIEASWKALVDSIEYGLTFTQKEKEVQAS